MNDQFLLELLYLDSSLRICSYFWSFFWELYFHGLSKNGIVIKTVLGHSCLVYLFKHDKSLPSHLVILLTNNLNNLSISFKQQIQSIFQILGFYFFINILDIQCLFRLICILLNFIYLLFKLVLSYHFNLNKVYILYI